MDRNKQGEAAADAVEKQRRIQAEVDERDKERSGKPENDAMQAGARR